MANLATYGDRIMTRLAGKLTPAARVDVHANKQRIPSLNACSISWRSCVVKPTRLHKFTTKILNVKLLD